MAAVINRAQEWSFTRRPDKDPIAGVGSSTSATSKSAISECKPACQSTKVNGAGTAGSIRDASRGRLAPMKAGIDEDNPDRPEIEHFGMRCLRRAGRHARRAQVMAHMDGRELIDLIGKPDPDVQ